MTFAVGRSDADIHHGRLAVLCENSVDTWRRHKFITVAQIQIGCGVAKQTTFMRSTDHTSRDVVETAEQKSSLVDESFTQQTAHQRGADRCFPAEIGWYLLHESRQTQPLLVYNGDAKIAAVADILLETFRAVVAEVVIVADVKAFDMQRLLQHRVHERTGRESCHVDIERQHHTIVYSCRGQQGETLFCRGKQMRTIIGLQHLTGMLAKSNDHRGETMAASIISNAAQQILVTAMDSIEESDSSRARRKLSILQRLIQVDNFHNGSIVSTTVFCRKPYS